MDVMTARWQAIGDAGLFAATWGVYLTATYLGIQRGGRELPLSRSHYFVFIVAFNVAAIFVFWVAGLLGGLISWAGAALLLPLIALALIGFITFMGTRYTARRLKEIGWSPHWAWLLLVSWIGYAFMILLIFMPPTKDVARRFAGHKAG